MKSRSALGSSLGVSIVLAALVVAACSSDETTGTPTPPGSDAATTDGGGTPETGASDTSTAADTGSACNAVVNGGGVVPETAGVGAKPAPAGGTIVDGTYFMTKHEVFPPANAGSNTRKRTIVFAGNAFQTHDDDPGKKLQLTGTFTTSGTDITFNVTCPMTASVTRPYTATATTYTNFSASDDLFIFTKQ